MGLADDYMKKEPPKVMMKKFSKQSVLYVFRPETQYQCKDCPMAKMGSTLCALYGPGETINTFGTCGLWTHKDPDSVDVPMLGVVTKIESGYLENKVGFSCKRCEHFEIGTCSRIDENSEGDTPGIIHPNACCNKWEADKIRGSMTTEQLTRKLSKTK